ncbi:DUF3077 domain-containing protein [Pseudomonas putida]
MNVCDTPCTHHVPFGKSEQDGQFLFAVQPGIPLLEALEQAALAMQCATAIHEELAMGDFPDDRRLRWAAVRLGEWSSALVDAAVQGLTAERFDSLG